MKRRSECSGHASFHSFLCYCKHCMQVHIAVAEVLSVYKQQTSSLLLYICDYTCVECATWSILAGLAHSSSWISEEKLCGKTSLLIRQTICVKNLWPHPPCNNTLPRGHIRTPNWVSIGKVQTHCQPYSDVTPCVKNENVINGLVEIIGWY